MVRRNPAIDSGPSGSGGGLGPRGRGIFERLFGSSRAAPAKPAQRREAVSIALASGKGGTGKSFLATSLAVVLQQAGHRTCLVDCDFGLASDHLLLGVKPRRTMQQLLSREARIEDVRVTTDAGPGLVPGGSGVRKMANLSDQELSVLGEVFGEIARNEDVLLLDVGAGIAVQSILTILSADHVVLVTQPEIAALTDAYAVVKCVAKIRPSTSFSVVVNRVLSTQQGEQAFAKLFEVAKRHTDVDLQLLGTIHEDAMVTQRRLGQMPLVLTHPEAQTSRAVRAIAEQLGRCAAPLGPRSVDNHDGIEARFGEHRLFL